MIENKNVWVYDIETLKSCFTYIAINVDTNEIVKYVIHKDRDDSLALIDHLKSIKGQIAFNNIGFDYPVIHEFLDNIRFKYNTPEETINELYVKAQSIISEQNKGTFGFDHFKKTLKEYEYIIPQLDLFRIWHFNNAARKTSLKALQIAINYPNVMECDIPFNKEDITLEEVENILEYNLNDVLSTLEIYKLTLDKIKLRKEIKLLTNINCLNYPDVKTGEEIILTNYCNLTNTDKWDIKKLRTRRSEIVLNDAIFNYINFKSKEFNELLKWFKSLILKDTFNISKSIIYKEFKYDYGLGGIHGCIKPGVYESDNDYFIIDCDVSSLYPSIAINNNVYPKHLGKEFLTVYNNILIDRLKAKQEGNKTINEAYKLALNGAYGKTNDQYSFLYDPLMTMTITCNGQLLLTMLCEQLVDNISDLTVLQVNTDGITVKIHKDYISTYYSICSKWEIDTKLALEYVNYSKMVIMDVNNYCSVTDKNKIKQKGLFVINKELHQDNSFKIIPIALQEYFVNNTPIEQTIKNHSNIYDFCGRQKFNSDSYGEIKYVSIDISNNPVIKVEKQQKNVRYFISNKGSTFIKKYTKGSTEFIHKGYNITIFNKYIEKSMTDYNINYKWYIKETQKIIEQIETKQLQLL